MRLKLRNEISLNIGMYPEEDQWSFEPFLRGGLKVSEKPTNQDRS
jgi:hypothetical protein